MSDFDFRKLLGTADVDPKLADGIDAYEATAGQHWLMMSKKPGMRPLVEHLTRSIILNANTNGLCTAGLLGLVVARVGQIAFRELAEGVGDVQREHVIEELQAVLDAMRRGEA